MNLRRKKEPDLLAPTEAEKVAERITNARPRKRPPRKAPAKVAEPEPEPQYTEQEYRDVEPEPKMDFKLPQFGTRPHTPHQKYAAEKPDRDIVALTMDVCIGILAVILVGVGLLLTTQPGTPSNLAWIHGENGLLGLLIMMIYFRKR